MELLLLTKGALSKYHILILDEKGAEDAWVSTTTEDLEDEGYIVKHAKTTGEAYELINSQIFDLLILDIDLGGREDGVDFQNNIRADGFSYPIIFVTGNAKYSNFPISYYEAAFASGPVTFYDKTSKKYDLEDLVKESLNRVDPVRRSLKILKESGITNLKFSLGDESFSIDEILSPNPKSNEFVLILRESLNAFLMENGFRG